MSAEQTVDTPVATGPTAELAGALDLAAAQEKILNLLDADEAPPVEEDSPVEETESEPLEEEEVSEDEADELEESDEDEEEYEGTDNREDEGDEVDVYSVKVDGEEIEVSLEELVSGYHRQSDYTKKTQEISEERKAIEEYKNQFDGQMTQLNQERQQYQQALGQLGQQLSAGLNRYANVDWAKLKQDDPIEYVTKRDEFRSEQERIQAVQQQQGQIAHQQQQEFAHAHQKAVAEEGRKLHDLIPNWSDPVEQPKIAGQIRTYGLGQGYSKEEIDGLVDARSVNVLLKAMKYDALQSADIKTKKVKNKPKMVKAGAKRAKADSAKRRKADSMKRLRKTGDTKDAARLLEDLI